MPLPARARASPRGLLFSYLAVVHLATEWPGTDITAFWPSHCRSVLAQRRPDRRHTCPSSRRWSGPAPHQPGPWAMLLYVVTSALLVRGVLARVRKAGGRRTAAAAGSQS